MHQELASAQRVLVRSVSLFERTDVTAYQPYLTIPDIDIAFLDIYIPLPYRFNFGSGQLDSGFYLFLDEVFMISFSVIRYNFYTFDRGHSSFLLIIIH